MVERGSPVLFAPIAASCPGKKVAAVTKIAPGEEPYLLPLRSAGVDVFAQPGETARYRVVFETANVDERRVFLAKRGDPFTLADMPPLPPCLAHLCCMGDTAFQLDLIRSLRSAGFRISVDMQGFVLQPDEKTGAVHPRDVPEKREIVAMTDFVKLDVMEAQILTGAETLEDQSAILETWGGGEIVITSSEGALARSKGRTSFARFTNRSVIGRMGRGDTVMGSYLARRLDHSMEEALSFAVALTSIKMESSGPFKGSLHDVIERMGGDISANRST